MTGLPTNVNINIYSVDRTSTGHILGRATNLGQKLTFVQDRKIDRISVAFIRLFTHTSMFLGANNNVQVCIVIEILLSFCVTERIENFNMFANNPYWDLHSRVFFCFNFECPSSPLC